MRTTEMLAHAQSHNVSVKHDKNNRQLARHSIRHAWGFGKAVCWGGETNNEPSQEKSDFRTQESDFETGK